MAWEGELGPLHSATLSENPVSETEGGACPCILLPYLRTLSQSQREEHEIRQMSASLSIVAAGCTHSTYYESSELGPWLLSFLEHLQSRDSWNTHVKTKPKGNKLVVSSNVLKET